MGLTLFVMTILVNLAANAIVSRTTRRVGGTV
jgi:ABC-type phosphate transport system permease subunit